ncbi:uncharacterized protein BCR38DRAFT_24587 [Pseudomassariella vexata]|uniref:Uncharacterized protein n=1 Tax=Pseudomassariella vexata TaxID=1141098 RepID=A0A1Y2EKB4_9PEZI|nr:uncharacterized protein BCR38DRAFT_24587 [Pseudomassariella vexata]ORY71970.1 hypothetical protein BCR38DRAFT_24587 [Pseudomassariella vexata]
MSSARKLLFGLLVVFTAALGVATAVSLNRQPCHDTTGSGEENAMVDGQILHAYFPGTFKHGVYASDEDAIEAVRSNDAALAESLVELAKRQTQNQTDSGDSSTSVVTTIDATTVVSTTITTPKPSTITTVQPTTTAIPPTTTARRWRPRL